MSENIRGITFAEQAVTPADDAIVRRAMLSDGVLTGCDVSYSGSTLTMAAGYIIACGRAFQITTAQNWAVVDATSGVARLLLTIDMTKTATEDTFSQIGFSLEYATAEDGFMDLVQDDINISGIKYQVVVAVVSLGTGGITGILSKLEQAESGGGLNFKVVPGETRPGTGRENTIWVKTDRITNYYFSSTQPATMQDGDVWFPVSASGAVTFNALKKNVLQVHPVAARQYISGAMKRLDADIYQNRRWIQFSKTWNGELYEPDNQYIDFTGGWSSAGWSGFGGVGIKAPTIDSSGITLLTDAGTTFPLAGTVNKVDLRDFSTVYVTVESIDAQLGAWVGINTSEKVVGIADAYAMAAKAEIKNTGEIALPYSGIDAGYIVVWVYGYTAAGKKLRVTRIRME